jgi:acetyl-CoA carboxylase biotin carboxyl carrier protein
VNDADREATPVTALTAPILAAVDRLAPALQASGLDELEVEVGELRVRLARPRPVALQGAGAAPPASGPPAPAGSAATAPPAAASPFGEPSPGRRFVSAPLTGVWYAAPSPGARAYVQVGDEIAAGQVVGLIEAMKLFNEIKSDAAGRIARVLVESGTLVKRQQPILEIEPI